MRQTVAQIFSKLIAILIVIALAYVLCGLTISRPYQKFAQELPNKLPCPTATPAANIFLGAGYAGFDWCGAVYWAVYIVHLLLIFAPFYVLAAAIPLVGNIMQARNFSLIPRARRQELLRRAAVTSFHALDPYEFEDLVCEIIRAMGYKNARVTQRARDGGFDIEATSARLQGGKLLVECKRYAPDKRIGVQLIKEFHGVMQNALAYEGWFVTTSDFTAPAREHADSVPHLHLMNGIQLAGLYHQHLLKK